MTIRVSKSMYIIYKKNMKKRIRQNIEHEAATRIQRAVLEWLYAPPCARNKFVGGPMYRKFVQSRFGEVDSWEEYADEVRPMFVSHLNIK